MTQTDQPGRVTLSHPDGSTSTLLLVEAERGVEPRPDTETRPDTEHRPAVLVLPGVAVGARYYLPLARALAAEGVDVALTELRGQGESTYRVGRGGGPAGYHESAAEDIPLAIDAMARHFGDRPVVLLGHSMGAQLGVYHLARRDPRVVGLVAVASQSPYHRGYPAPMNRRLRLGSVLMPTVGRILGSVPGQFFGADGHVPTSRIHDWARLAAAGSMQPARADLDYREGLTRVTVPALAVVFADDPLAPASAAATLLELLPAARTTLESEPTPHGHNGWARDPDAVVTRVVAWMDREFTAPPSTAQGAAATRTGGTPTDA